MKKTGLEVSLSGFLEKFKPSSFKFFRRGSRFPLLLIPLFFFTGNFNSAHAAWWNTDSEGGGENNTKPKIESINVPDDVQEEIQDITKDYLATIRGQVQDNPYFYEPLVDEEMPPQNVGEAFALINSKISNAIAKSSFNSLYEPPPYTKDPEAFKRFQRSLFETMTRLADQAQEPLFLDNKHQFSVEIRAFPFGDHLGFIVTPRKQWSDRYISGQFLYANSSKRPHEVAGSLTYGEVLNGQFAGSVTLGGGYKWGAFQRSDYHHSYRSNPKVWVLGLSPMLVYYVAGSVPLDLFLGGDVYYSSRQEVEESSHGETCTYASEKGVLYRVKAGPSYTIKRSGKTRLYQTKLSLAGNIQSQIPDRFTIAPSILFESQGHESRGGYLFKFHFNLGLKKRTCQIAYGLRF